MHFNLVASSIVNCGLIILCLPYDATSQYNILGAGKWSVLFVQHCENDADLPWSMRLRRHKLNRTHEAYDVELNLQADLDESYGVRAEICKMVDGGCKSYGELKDDCLANLTRKFAARNAKLAFIAARIDPPDFPIPKGEYTVENYILDTNDLSKNGVYGEFHGHVYVVKNGQDIMCAQGSLKYEPLEDFGLPASYIS